MQKVSLDDAFDSFDEQWSPRVAAELNGQGGRVKNANESSTS